MLDLLHVLPHEAVFIDDRHINVDGAMSIGMQAVRFTDVAHLRADLAELGVTVDSFC